MHWTGKIQPIAFTIFTRPVAWYGIVITLGMLIGLVLAIFLSKKIKLSADDLLEMFLIAIPLGVIGARLGYVITRFSEYFIHPTRWYDFLAIWDGGVTITWGAPCGILGGLLWAKWRKIDFILFTDCVFFVILLCQAIGRWGNFFNQELYGQAVTNPHLQYFPHSVYIASMRGWYQATFFYESMSTLSAFILLFIFTRRFYMRGMGLSLYAGVYFTIRFIMEFFRMDYSPMQHDTFDVTQIIAAIIAASGWAVFFTLLIKKLKRGEQVWFKHGVFLPPAKVEERTKLTTDN